MPARPRSRWGSRSWPGVDGAGRRGSGRRGGRRRRRGRPGSPRCGSLRSRHPWVRRPSIRLAAGRRAPVGAWHRFGVRRRVRCVATGGVTSAASGASAPGRPGSASGATVGDADGAVSAAREPGPSTLAMNLTLTPSTSAIALRSSSLTLWPGAPPRKPATSCSLGNASTSTSPSRNSRTCAVNATIQALRFVRCRDASTSGHASRICCSVTGPTGFGAAADVGAAARAGSAGSEAAGFEPTAPAVPDDAGVGAASSPAGAGAEVASAPRAAGRDEAGVGDAAGAAARVAAAGSTGAPPRGAEAWPAASVAASVTPTRRSRRSTRARAPRSVSSLDGTSTRASMSSRCSRGEVAPVISVSVWFTRSATRESSAEPNVDAWAAMRASSSAGTPRSTAAAVSGDDAATTMRSRRRSSRSSTNRRGSCPVCTTRSAAAKAPAASFAPMASTTSSRRAPWV